MSFHLHGVGWSLQTSFLAHTLETVWPWMGFTFITFPLDFQTLCQNAFPSWYLLFCITNNLIHFTTCPLLSLYMAGCQFIAGHIWRQAHSHVHSTTYRQFSTFGLCEETGVNPWEHGKNMHITHRKGKLCNPNIILSMYIVFNCCWDFSEIWTVVYILHDKRQALYSTVLR